MANFDIFNVPLNGKCWNLGMSISWRTIFSFEQCVRVVTRSNVTLPIEISWTKSLTWFGMERAGLDFPHHSMDI